MSFLELLRSRRSIRRFQARPVEQSTINNLIEAALRAPSSRGINPWEFIVVTDPVMIDKLSRAKVHGSAFLKNAPLAIIVCADPEKSDVWTEDASIASILLHLAAADLGLGSCWIQIRLRQHDNKQSAESYVATLVGLREGLAIESIIGIGYPVEDKPGHPDSSLLHNAVHFERYGRKD